jgi:starch synthase
MIVQFVILGSGDKSLESFYGSLPARYPGVIGSYIGYSNELAHLIEAGSDGFVMPSRYEPCGLNQMYSLKYGTVPIVRETGGLADTVKNFDPESGEGWGFTFKEYSASAMMEAIQRALKTYQDKETWRKIQIAGMKLDYSWQRSAEQYLELYQRAAEK